MTVRERREMKQAEATERDSLRAPSLILCNRQEFCVWIDAWLNIVENMIGENEKWPTRPYQLPRPRDSQRSVWLVPGGEGKGGAGGRARAGCEGIQRVN